MRLDELGYPAPQGASDFEDSSHLAGLLAITEHHQAVDCRKYVTGYVVASSDSPTWFKPTKRIYVRCPNTKYDFSRDQFAPLAAGLIKQGYAAYVNLEYITGRDLLPPSVRGLVRIAQGKNPQLLHRFWLKLEIYWHSYIQPLEEPNQIIALCLSYGDEYLKLWTSKNKLWRWSIYRYWSQLDGQWRGEPELADHIIKYIESKLIA